MRKKTFFLVSFTAGCWNTFRETSEIWIHEGTKGVHESCCDELYFLLNHLFICMEWSLGCDWVAWAVTLPHVSNQIPQCCLMYLPLWSWPPPFLWKHNCKYTKASVCGFFFSLFCVFLLPLNLSYVQNFCRFFSHANLIPFSHYLTMMPFFPLEQVVLLKCNRFL